MHEREYFDDLETIVAAVPDQIGEDLEAGTASVAAEQAEGVRGLADARDRGREVVDEPIDLVRRVERVPVLRPLCIAFGVVPKEDRVGHARRLRKDVSTSSHDLPTSGSASASASR